MKTAKVLVMLFLVGLLGSSCATVSQLNAEYEEEMARVERMSPAAASSVARAGSFSLPIRDLRLTLMFTPTSVELYLQGPISWGPIWPR